MPRLLMSFSLYSKRSPKRPLCPLCPLPNQSVQKASRLHVYPSEFQTEVSKKHQYFLSIHLVLQYVDQFVGAQRSMIVRCVNVVLNHDKRILVKLIFPMINYMEFAINQKRL